MFGCLGRSRHHALIGLLVASAPLAAGLSSAAPLARAKPRSAGAMAIAARTPVLPASSAGEGRIAPSWMPPGSRLYAPSSPFNEPIPAGAAVAPESASMVESLEAGASQKGFVLTVGEWSVPTYVAGPGTPRETVALRKAPPRWNEPSSVEAFPPGWSANLSTVPADQLRGVPIPAAAEPDDSLDAHMTILDPAAGCEYDLYGAHRTPSGWQAVWANGTRIGGSGVYPAGMGVKAAGFAGLAGLIWPRELAAGRIDHALLFSYPFTREGGPVWPATSSDGRSSTPGAIPEGSRVRLNPDLDLRKLNLAPYQQTIAAALQQYGMILGDTGGAVGLYAVGRQSFSGNPYPMLPPSAFPDLGSIPVDQLEVLAAPAQSSRADLQLGLRGCASFG